MKSAKLITYLGTLSKKEVSIFNDFVNSPFHNKSNLVIQLWDYLKPFVPKLDSPKLDKSLIIKHLYQETSTNTNKRFNDLTVTFCKVFEAFVQQQHLKKNKIIQEKLLVHALGERQLMKSFYKTIEGAKKKIKKKSIKNIQDYEQLLFLEKERYFHNATPKFNLNENGLETILSLTDSLSVMQKMKYVLEARQIELLINKTFEITPFNLEITQIQDYNNNLLFKIYAKQIDILKYPESADNNFQLLKTLHSENLIELKNSSEKLNTLNFLINYAAVQINKGNLVYYKEMFDLLRLGIEKRISLHNGHIDKVLFKNVCIIAAELGYVDWLTAFVSNDTNFKLLPKADYKSVRDFCNVLLHYAQKSFETTLHSLHSIKLDSIDLHFWNRTIELRCLYEMYKNDGADVEDLIDAKLEAFRRYCYRIETLGKHKVNSNLNFIKIYTRLCHEGTFLKHKKEAFIDEVKLTNTVCKVWLLSKIETL